jgi:hypothetical protein
MEWTEESVETFIVSHRDKFNTYDTSLYHSNKFWNKLCNKFKRVINIGPYLLKTGTVWIFVAILSFIVWNSFIRKDRNEVTLKQKIENIIIFKN